MDFTRAKVGLATRIQQVKVKLNCFTLKILIDRRRVAHIMLKSKPVIRKYSRTWG